jgi:hypothetical protein
LPQNLALSDVALFEHIYAKKNIVYHHVPYGNGNLGVLYDCHPFSSIFKHTNVHLLKVTSVIWDGFPKLAFLRAFLQGNQQGLHLLAAQHGTCHQSILPGGSGSGPSFYRAEDMET